MKPVKFFKRIRSKYTIQFQLHIIYLPITTYILRIYVSSDIYPGKIVLGKIIVIYITYYNINKAFNKN